MHPNHREQGNVPDDHLSWLGRSPRFRTGHGHWGWRGDQGGLKSEFCQGQAWEACDTRSITFKAQGEVRVLPHLRLDRRLGRTFSQRELSTQRP